MDRRILGDAIRQRTLQNTQGTTTANVITDPEWYIHNATPGVDDETLNAIIAAASDIDDFYARIAEWRRSRPG